MAERRMILEGIIAAPAAISWIKTTKNARAMAVFQQSCTFIREDGKMLSLVTEGLGPGPFSMVVEPRYDSLAATVASISALRVGASVLIDKQTLALDWLVVDASRVKVWNPQPDWEAMSTEIFRKTALVLKNLLILHGPAGSLADIFTSAELNPTQQLVKDLWSDLAIGLGERKLANYHHLLGKISGLGNGLTPAGDDFLLGIMMAIWSCLPSLEAKWLCSDIVQASIGRTTTLSAAWLDAAGKGEAAYYWHDLIESMVSRNPGELLRCGRRIISVGHSSGADALTGFYLAGKILSHHPQAN